MSRSHHLSPAVCAAMLLAFAGCGGSQRQWEITVENKMDAPCSFFIELGTDGNSSSVKVENVAKGKPITLIVGSSKTIVQSVRVVTDKAEETLKPKVELPVGKRYAISVGAEGKVEASAVDRWTTAIRASVVPSWLLAVAEFARIHPVGATA